MRLSTLTNALGRIISVIGLYSMNDDPAFVVRAIELGAQGYVSKGDDPRMLVNAVRKVAAGDNFISPPLAEAVTFSGASMKANPVSQMTARELEILRLLGRGDKIVEVADTLEISYKTVANTTSLLKQKLGAKKPFGPDSDRRRDGARTKSFDDLPEVSLANSHLCEMSQLAVCRRLPGNEC